jgi:hypothetical protein
MGEVISLYIVVAFLVSGGLGPFVGGRQNKTKEIPMSVAHLTQKLLLVLPISILQDSWGVVLLLSPFVQSLSSNVFPFS